MATTRDPSATAPSPDVLERAEVWLVSAAHADPACPTRALIRNLSAALRAERETAMRVARVLDGAVGVARAGAAEGCCVADRINTTAWLVDSLARAGVDLRAPSCAAAKERVGERLFSATPDAATPLYRHESLSECVAKLTGRLAAVEDALRRHAELTAHEGGAA